MGLELRISVAKTTTLPTMLLPAYLPNASNTLPAKLQFLSVTYHNEVHIVTLADLFVHRYSPQLRIKLQSITSLSS